MYASDKAAGEAQVAIEPWRRVLLDAADLLENKGWCQFVREDCYGERHCVLGAIDVSAGYDPGGIWPPDERKSGDWQIAVRAVAGQSVRPTFACADWNNHPLRTAAEVIATLRKVATDPEPK